MTIEKTKDKMVRSNVRQQGKNGSSCNQYDHMIGEREEYRRHCCIVVHPGEWGSCSWLPCWKLHFHKNDGLLRQPAHFWKYSSLFCLLLFVDFSVEGQWVLVDSFQRIYSWNSDFSNRNNTHGILYLFQNCVVRITLWGMAIQGPASRSHHLASG
jgi:hypothetical protein